MQKLVIDKLLNRKVKGDKDKKDEKNSPRKDLTRTASIGGGFLDTSNYVKLSSTMKGIFLQIPASILPQYRLISEQFGITNQQPPTARVCQCGQRARGTTKTGIKYCGSLPCFKLLSAQN
jgi:hypothetical protein